MSMKGNWIKFVLYFVTDVFSTPSNLNAWALSDNSSCTHSGRLTNLKLGQSLWKVLGGSGGGQHHYLSINYLKMDLDPCHPSAMHRQPVSDQHQLLS